MEVERSEEGAVWMLCKVPNSVFEFLELFLCVWCIAQEHKQGRRKINPLVPWCVAFAFLGYDILHHLDAPESPERPSGAPKSPRFFIRVAPGSLEQCGVVDLCCWRREEKKGVSQYYIKIFDHLKNPYN